MNGENCILISCFICTYYEYNYIDQILFLVIAALPGLLSSNRLIELCSSKILFTMLYRCR